MSWSDPRTWAGAEILTATNLNAHVRDNMRELWHQIAYVEFSASVTLAGATEAAPTDIVSSGALTYSAFPILVEFYAPLYNNNSQASNGINLWDGATDLGRLVASTGASLVAPVHVQRQFTPSAASHTYKIRGWGSSANGVVTAGAGGTGTTMPGFIRIWQRGA